MRAPAPVRQPDVIPAGYEKRLDSVPNSTPVWPGKDPAGRSRYGNSGSGSANPTLSPAIRGDPTRSEPSPSNLVPVGQTASGQKSVLPANEPRPSGRGGGYPAAAPQWPQATDQFRYILRRLRDLGATYYLLESWGAKAEYYRFHARIMAVGGSANYVRHFEATDTDALRAMARVVEEVEAWRGSR